ncbi:MAG: hypothetical protein ACYDFT_08760, partial [Thermoplasmata archaeon]
RNGIYALPRSAILVRSGLVLVGVAFLVVGGAALSVLYAAPPAPVRDSTVSMVTIPIDGTAPVWSAPLWGQNGSDESFTLRWHSTIPVTLGLADAMENRSCPHRVACPDSPMVWMWNESKEGNWSSSGDPDCPYWVEASSPTGAAATISIETTSRASFTDAGPAVELWVGTISAVLILGVGSIALFLGLFLLAGSFRPPRTGPPRGPEGLDPHGVEPPPSTATYPPRER